MIHVMPFEYACPLIVSGSILMSVISVFFVRALANRMGVIDQPSGGRKIHTQPTALWGGLVTGTSIIIGLLLSMPFANGTDVSSVQLWGFIVAICVLMIGGLIDDAFDMPPIVQIISPVIASIIVLATGSGIIQVTNPFEAGAISLVWTRLNISGVAVSLPSDFLTIMWLLLVTYAMKILDGLDGLVSGLTIVGALLIASLAVTPAYFQPTIVLFALIVAGSYAGFLPFNRTGSMFLGEAGSTIAGFSLGVLAIISGAKVAIASAALAIPLVDIVLVVGGRLLRGASPFKADTSHLHFRLLDAGFTKRSAVRFIWAIALVFGLIALTLQTRGKIFLLSGLVACILFISYFSYVRSNHRKHES